MEDRERLCRIARLMLELGADVNRCLATVELTFRRPDKAVRDGLAFRENMFSVNMNISDRLIAYQVGHGGLLSAHVILNGWDVTRHEADLRSEAFSPEFWDAVYRMVRKIRPALFSPSRRFWGTSEELLADVRRQHRWSPTREKLLLQRALEAFWREEYERVRSRRRQANSAKRAAYEEMLRLSARAPHSLNRLRAAAGPVSTERINRSYWKVRAATGGGQLEAGGIDPLFAAWELLCRLPQRNAGLPAGIGKGACA